METNKDRELKALLKRLELPQFITVKDHNQHSSGPFITGDDSDCRFDVKDSADTAGMSLNERPYEMFKDKFTMVTKNVSSQKNEGVCQVRFHYNKMEIGNFTITKHISNQNQHYVTFCNTYNHNESKMFKALSSRDSNLTEDMRSWFEENYRYNVADYRRKLRVLHGQ